MEKDTYLHRNRPFSFSHFNYFTILSICDVPDAKRPLVSRGLSLDGGLSERHLLVWVLYAGLSSITGDKRAIGLGVDPVRNGSQYSWQDLVTSFISSDCP